jgi:hypothetical protein
VSQQINLFSPLFLKKKRYFSALTMVQALATVLVGSLAIYGFELRQNATLERAVTENDRQLGLHRVQLLQLSKELSPQGTSRALAEDVSQAEDRLQRRRALLADLQTGVGGNAEGFARYLEALARQTVPGLWLTALELSPQRAMLAIRGRALDSQLVPAYIRSLNREPAFSGKPVGELVVTARAENSAQAPRYVEFSLSIPLRGEP